MVGELTVLLGASIDATSTEESIELIRRWFENAVFAVLVDFNGVDALDWWDRARPSAVIPSTYTSEQVAACLAMVSVGARFVPMDCIDEIFQHVGRDRSCAETPDVDQEHLKRIASKLTPRQREVMRYVAMGRSKKYIASELDVCESTIKVHVSELLRRLGATSRTHAAWLFNHLPTDAGSEELY